MRTLLLTLVITQYCMACRTSQPEDQRDFAKSRGTNDGVAGVTIHPPPPANQGTPVPLLPKPAEPLEKGAFYVLCEARAQLSSAQALTVKALLAATHQQSCTAGEEFLRDGRNQSLQIESEELVEVQSLTLLQNYPHIRNVYILVAKGVDALCPLGYPQICHFRKPEF